MRQSPAIVSLVLCVAIALLMVQIASSSTALSLSYSADGKVLVSGSVSGSDRMVALRDPQTGDVVRIISKSNDAAFGVAFSPDGDMLALRDAESVELWDWRKRLLLRSLAAPPGEAVGTQLAFSPDGKLIACGGTHRYYSENGESSELADGKVSRYIDDGEVRVWHAQTASCCIP